MAGFAKNEAEIAERASRFLKAELKRAGLTYDDLAERLGKHGLKGETRNSVTSKLARGTFPATFFIGSLAALEREGVSLAEL
jgi:transcriptional regulator with XRE-family HTH domain